MLIQNQDLFFDESQREESEREEEEKNNNNLQYLNEFIQNREQCQQNEQLIQLEEIGFGERILGFTGLYQEFDQRLINLFERFLKEEIQVCPELDMEFVWKYKCYKDGLRWNIYAQDKEQNSQIQTENDQQNVQRQKKIQKSQIIIKQKEINESQKIMINFERIKKNIQKMRLSDITIDQQKEEEIIEIQKLLEKDNEQIQQIIINQQKLYQDDIFENSYQDQNLFNSTQKVVKTFDYEQNLAFNSYYQFQQSQNIQQNIIKNSFKFQYSKIDQQFITKPNQETFKKRNYLDFQIIENLDIFSNNVFIDLSNEQINKHYQYSSVIRQGNSQANSSESLNRDTKQNYQDDPLWSQDQYLQIKHQSQCYQKDLTELMLSKEMLISIYHDSFERILFINRFLKLNPEHFKISIDLNLNERILLIEYFEQFPLVLGSNGMHSIIVNYINRSKFIESLFQIIIWQEKISVKDITEELFFELFDDQIEQDFGSIGVLWDLRLLQELKPLNKDLENKKSCQFIINNLYSSQLFKYEQNKRDFLLVYNKQTKKYYIKKINSLRLSPLIEPKLYSFGVNHEDTEKIKRKILQDQIKKLFDKNEEICIKTLRKQFPFFSKQIIRQELELLNGYQIRQGFYIHRMIRNSQSNQTDGILISPEKLCIYQKIHSDYFYLEKLGFSQQFIFDIQSTHINRLVWLKNLSQRHKEIINLIINQTYLKMSFFYNLWDNKRLIRNLDTSEDKNNWNLDLLVFQFLQGYQNYSQIKNSQRKQKKQLDDIFNEIIKAYFKQY